MADRLKCNNLWPHVSYIFYVCVWGPYLTNFTSIWPVNIWCVCVCMRQPSWTICLPLWTSNPSATPTTCDRKRVTCACDCVYTKWGTHIERRNEFIIELQTRPWVCRCASRSSPVGVPTCQTIGFLFTYTTLRNDTRSELNFNGSASFASLDGIFYIAILFIMFLQLKSAKVCRSRRHLRIINSKC